MLIGLGEDMAPIDFEFTRSKGKVTSVTFFLKKKRKHMVFAHYLENNLSQSVYISHADWSW